MPFTVDDDRLSSDPARMKPGVTPLVTLDPANPPTKQIPHMDFPRVVYKHPREAFRKVEHRNTMREIVEIEMVANDHLTRVVADQNELEQALASGWDKKPYIQEPLPDPLAGVYEEKGKRKSA